MPRRLLAAAAALAATAAVAVPGAHHLAPARAASPACEQGPVVAHRNGSVVSTTAIAPTVCGVETGYPGAESHIVATASAVVFTPALQPSGTLGTGAGPDVDGDTQSNASPAGLAVTDDAGGTWHFVKPAGATWNPTDHSDYVDPATGRVFFEDYGPIPLDPAVGPSQEGAAHIMWTDDAVAGAWHHTAVVSLFLPENPRFVAAPSPPGTGPDGQPSGYPNVVYFCANTNVGFVSPVIAGRACFRSFDGGSSFGPAGLLLSGTVPQHPECNGQGEAYSAIDGYYPQAAPDGTLIVMVACGGHTYLARSTDEASTFPVIHDPVTGAPRTVPVPPASLGDIGGPDLRIDTAGVMYVMWGDSKVHLIVSSDGGATWSSPLDMTAPGVVVDQWAMAQGGSTIAATYLGHRGNDTLRHAFLTASTDGVAALAAGSAVFWTAQANDPSQPILFGDAIAGSGFLPVPGTGERVPYPPPFGNQMFGNDFIGATVAPDGSVWGSFDRDCGPDPDSGRCPDLHDQTRGFAGHLVPAPG